MKCILNVNFGGSVGTGATRRYIELFNYISVSSDDFLLILNIDLYKNLKRFNILKSNKNVVVLNVALKNKPAKTKILPSINYSSKFNNQNNLKVYLKKKLGAYKYFLKLSLKWIQFSYQFINVIIIYKVDTVYAIFTGGIWAWPITKLLNLKLIFGSNSYSFANTSKSKLSFFTSDYWVHKYCDKIDFLSPAMVKTFEKNIMVRDKKHYSISPSSFINSEKFYPESPKVNWVVFACRMEEHKNPILLLNAIKIINQMFPEQKNFEIFLLGSGKLDSEITSFILSNGLKNVKFIGEVPEVSPFIRKSKIFISIQDGNNYPSQSLLEAMACENAIIASDVGETRKLVTDNEGILVSLDAVKIAEAIQFLLSNPNECERMGKNARKKVLEEHNIEKFVKYFFEISDFLRNKD